MGIVVAPDGSAVRTSLSQYANLQESISLVARQIEDLRWTNISSEQGREPSYEDRRDILGRLRLYRRRSPLAKQAANLLQHYTLGKGISLTAANRTKIAPIVDEFWEDPSNSQVFTSHQAQKEALDSLFTDGDLFLVLFPDTDNGTLHLGILDAMFVEDIVTDPENAKIPRWYKVRKPTSAYNFGSGAWEPRVSDDFTYYRDWRNDESFSPPAKQTSPGLIYHVKINSRGRRFGESELATAIDWLKAHKDFMEDRASLNRAASQVAWKKKRKGGPNEIAAEAARIQSSLVTSQSRSETNPPHAPAATIVENEGSNLEWVKTDVGKADADERILRMMAGAGMGGVPNHYFGDEAQANLATATAMELPLLKAYQDWQTLWGDVLRDLVGFLLDTAHKAGRIGDRDDSTRYSERITTPRQVLARPDVADDSTAAGPEGVGLSEAFGGAPGEAGKSGALTVTMLPKTTSVEQIQRANDTSGKIDWFVDVDFPPIVQKEMQSYITALKSLYEMMPTGNIESQKLVVELLLRHIDENNIDQTMERLFPADAAPDELRNAPDTVTATDPNALVGALKNLLGSAGANAAAKPIDGAPTPVAESLAEFRVRRVLAAARQASDALTAAG